MLDSLEQLDLEHFLLCLHDIDGSIAELVGKRMIDFGAREEERFWSNYNQQNQVPFGDSSQLLTFEIEEMRLLQERWMGKRSSRTDAGAGKLIAYVWCAVTVTDRSLTTSFIEESGEGLPNTCKLRPGLPVFLFHLIHPLGHSIDAEGPVLALPCLVVKARLSGGVVAGFAVFPYGIL